MTSPDVVTVSTHVAVDPQRAFAIFTEEVDAWWRRGPRYRLSHDERCEMRFEPGEGGRLVETVDGRDTLVGKVLAWEPGTRLVFESRARAFRDHEVTEVEVRFEEASGGTRVTIEHRGWSRLPDDHPVRHGLTGEAFVDIMSTWWAELAVSLAARCRARR